jgi:hypothetical protein
MEENKDVREVREGDRSEEGSRRKGKKGNTRETYV